MTGPRISFSVRHVTPETCIIDIYGELTMMAETALMAAFEEASESSSSAGAAASAAANAAASPTATPARLRNIILNFEPMTYMNSSGIGLLVMLLVRLNREGQKLMAVGLNAHYQRIFELTRLNEAIVVHKSEAEALASVAG